MWAMLSVEPVTRLSMQTTSAPWARRNSERWEPMNPAPPVTSTRTAAASGRQDRLAPDGVVLEAETSHALRLVEVAAVEDQGPSQQSAQPLQVEEPELVPLGEEHHRVRPLRRLVGRVAEGDAGGDEHARIVHRDRIVGADLHPRRLKQADHFEA